MMRKPQNKLAALAAQVNAYRKQGSKPAAAQVRAQSVEEMPANTEKIAERGYYDQGKGIELLVEGAAIAPAAQQMSVAKPLVQEEILDWNLPAVASPAFEKAKAQSLENGTYTQQRNGATTTVTKNDQGLYAHKQVQTEGVSDAEPDEETFKLDFEDDLRKILAGTEEDDDTFQMPAAKPVNTQTQISRQRSIDPTQPKAHSIFDKMAQGMEYAQTFDLGTVDMSSVFDQFDTAMEVNEISRAKTLVKPQAHEMAEVFDSFDAVETHKAEAMNLVPAEPAKNTKRPNWRPTNPNISGWERLMPTFGAEFYLLERSPMFMQETLEAFNTGQYAWIPLDLTTRAAEGAWGEGKIQVLQNSQWVDLTSIMTSLEGQSLSIERDFRIQITLQPEARTGETWGGNRIQTIVHEFALHGLQNAALLQRYRDSGGSPEALRQEYLKSVLLHIHHHQIRGELQPLNTQYQNIQQDVARALLAQPNWSNFGEYDFNLLSPDDAIPDALVQRAKHLQTQTPKQLPISFTYLLAISGERKADYNVRAFMNLFDLPFGQVTRAQLDDMMANRTLQEAIDFANSLRGN